MSAATAFKYYLLSNALLLVSYLALVAIRKACAGAGLSTSYSQLRRVARLLIVVSLVTPAVLHLVPRQALPRVEWEEVFPPAEMSANTHAPVPISRTQVIASAERETKNEAEEAERSWHKLAVFALALGALLSATRLALGFQKLFVITRRAMPLRLLGSVRIAVSETTTVPFSVRLARASWVILPQSILASARDYRLAIRHELQHHRSHDTTWAVLIELLAFVFYANPAIYLWKKELAELQEFSCDEALLARKRISAHEYGSCLVRVAETALASREMHAGTACMAVASRNPAYFKSFLRRRVEMFPQHIKNRRAGSRTGAAIGTMASIITVAVAYGAFGGLNPGEVVVNPEVQKIADSVLKKAVDRMKAKTGFAIVADPRTGQILAVANIDTTRSRSGYWALGEQFEPASVMKALVAAKAIDKGLVTRHHKLRCENSNYRYGDRIYHDWKKTGWDELTAEQAIAHSSDICTIKMGEKIGPEGVREMLAEFGFGPEGTAKDFPGAQPGELPPADSPKRPRVIPYVAMGAGFSVSPLEIVQAYGAIANGGNLMAPIAADVPDSKAKVLRRVLSPWAAEEARAILKSVVTEGTAKEFGQSALYTTAGKTGSSHYPRMMPFDRDSDFATFVGFAPANDPRIEIYVGIREPESSSGAHGSNHAAPVFREMAEEVLKLLRVPADKP